MEQTLIDLLSDDPWTRLSAAETLAPVTPAARYALRAALLGDPDARIRAQAAATLGDGPAGPEVQDWLAEGLGDCLPSVREACLRALGRHRAAGAAAACAPLSTEDPVWWVRRAALLALALSTGVAAIPTLRRTLGDPFWRVRHAAVQALGAIGDAHPEERAQILRQEPACRPVAAAALWYLRSRFDPSIDVHKFRLPERGDEPLWNADPAVTTARLRARPSEVGDLEELVGLLADPHQPLRELAAERLGAHASLATLRQALRHLEVPGPPHALETTWALLDSLGERARELSASILADPEADPGALRWAASWVVRLRWEELFAALAAQAQHPEPRARIAVAEALAQASAAEQGVLLMLLADGDAGVRGAAALALAARAEVAAADALQQMPAAEQSSRVRAARVSAAARRGDRAALAAAMLDPHPRPRALALAELAHLGELGTAAAANLSDPDPWIRAAVLRAVPAAWLKTLTTDPDPAVRRRALQLALAARQRLAPPARSQLAQAAAGALDPWLRARGCELLDLGADAELQALLRLSRDSEPMVRAAAAARLAALPDEQARLRQLLARPGLSAAERAAAYARLLREPNAATVALLAAALGSPADGAAEPPLVREQLRATALLLPEALLQSLLQALPESEQRALANLAAAPPPLPRSPVPPTLTAAPRRPLGRTGLLVSPLAISGAHELPSGALAQARQAGVNLFFTNSVYAN